MNLESKTESSSVQSVEDQASHREVAFYSLESGINVNVTSESFSPQSLIKKESIRENKAQKEAIREVINPEAATFFLPGYGMDTETKSVQNMAQSFADSTRSETFALSSRSVEHTTDTEGINLLQEEARALAQYIIEKGKKEVNLAGHSQGGHKAMTIAHILQEEYPEIEVRGLTLIAPMGLYDQNQKTLVKKFVNDGSRVTPIDLIKNPKVARDGLMVAGDLLKTTAKELLRSNINSYNRTRREVDEMSRTNPVTQLIKAPVVIILGAHDRVSDRESILPDNEEKNLQQELIDIDIPLCDIREYYLKQKLFPKSPYVRALFPTKEGNHSLPYLRKDSIANASKALLDRHHRDNEVS